MSETINTRRILELVEEKKEQFITLSDAIWAVPELGLAEHRSAGMLIQALEREGFQVERGIDGIKTAFVGTYGSGRPVIGLLAEYDALPGLSQEAACTSHKPLAEGEPGHGCGHNALGAGVVAAAVAVKDYLKEHPGAGTVKVFGCPGEEAGWSKMFLARDGYFKDVDACFTWHPGNCNSVQGYSSNANICVYFTFRGRSAHAAAAPHLGRSALDACELMNVGVNYLREHVPTEVRMHYAYQNAGEKAPNVVHANACLKYYIRAPKMALAVQVLERVKDVARGAALMTGTECDINVTAGMSDFIANDAISRLFVEAFNLAGPPQFDAQDEALARAFWDQYSENEKAAGMMRINLSYPDGEKFRDTPLVKEIGPYFRINKYMPGSTDVGDVSYVTPTGQLWVTCYANGTPGHSWQVTSQVASSITHKAVVCAAKTMALATVMAFSRPDVVEQAREELKERTGGVYVCPVEPGKKPVMP